MNVLVNGIGNIGQTVLAFLIKHKALLEIDTIYAFKNTPKAFDTFSVWEQQGVKFFFNKDKVPFAAVEFVFDCTASGYSIQNKQWYASFPNLKGANAQGTEHQFGNSIMLGLNNNLMANYKYQHVVSCNTHGILSLLKYYSKDLENIESADFVVIRRSEDIGNHDRLVSANVVARHRDPVLGTHHAEDANCLLKSMGLHIPLFSSDVTTPSQLMHSVRFYITLKKEADTGYPYAGITPIFDSNKIFEMGRRHGFQGRIFNQAIIVNNNVLNHDTTVKGWAFIPQEGNTVLTTIAGFLFRTQAFAKALKTIDLIAKESLLFIPANT